MQQSASPTDTEMKNLMLLAGAVLLTAITPLHADQTIAYPTADDALFTIVIPDDWELEQAESADDFFVVSGPTGATLLFRATPASVEETVAENFAYLEEEFTELQVSEPSEAEAGGFSSLAANGTGKAKEDGTPVSFGMAWIAFPNGKVAELWYEAVADDTEGAATAKAILESFEPVE